MNTNARRRLWPVVGLIAVIMAPPVEARQDARDLPDAATLIQRHVDAIGGRDAILRSRSTRAVGRFEMAAAGLSGELEILSARPNLSLTTVTVPGIGPIREGFDGEVGWATDPMSGARILEGTELEAKREHANMLAAVRDPSLFQSRETVELTELGGRSCYKVRLVWQSGRTSYDCFGVDDGLLVASIMTSESPMGSVEITVLVGEYRQFGDMLVATRSVQQIMGMEQVLTIENVEFDVVDPDAFALPAEIEAALRARSGG